MRAIQRQNEAYPRAPRQAALPTIVPPVDEYDPTVNFLVDDYWTGNGFDGVKWRLRDGADAALRDGYPGIPADLTGWRLTNYLRSKEGQGTLGAELVARAIHGEPTAAVMHRGVQLESDPGHQVGDEFVWPLSSFTPSLDDALKYAQPDFAHWVSDEAPEHGVPVVYTAEPGARFAPIRRENNQREHVGFGRFRVVGVTPPDPSVRRNYPEYRIRQVGLEPTEPEPATKTAKWKVDPNFFGALHEMGHVLDAVTGFDASRGLKQLTYQLYEDATGQPMSDEPGGHHIAFRKWLRSQLPGRAFEGNQDYDNLNPKEAIAACFAEHEANPEASSPLTKAIHQHVVNLSARAKRPTNLTTFRPRSRRPDDVLPHEVWETKPIPRGFLDGVQHVFQKYPQSRIVDMVEPKELSEYGMSPVTNVGFGRSWDTKPTVRYDDRAAIYPDLVDEAFTDMVRRKDISPWMWEPDDPVKTARVLVAFSEWALGNGLGQARSTPLGADPEADWDFYRQDLDATARMLPDHYFDGREDADLIQNIVRQKALRHSRDPFDVYTNLMSHPAVFPRFKRWSTDSDFDVMDFMDANDPMPEMPPGWTPHYPARSRTTEDHYMWHPEVKSNEFDLTMLPPLPENRGPYSRPQPSPWSRSTAQRLRTAYGPEVAGEGVNDLVRTAYRFAAVTGDFVKNLNDEFRRWWADNEAKLPPPDPYYDAKRGPIGNWPNVEAFLKDRYPAAYRNYPSGYEYAREMLDWDKNDPLNGVPAGPEAYATGPEAVSQYGYDPREIAAGMLLLHNGTDPQRANLAQEDVDRLADIVQKRMKMQRDYEQRQRALAFLRVAATHPDPALINDVYDLTEKLQGEFDEWAKTNGIRNPFDPVEGGGRGAIGYWPNIEDFFRARYPAAYQGLRTGWEEAAPQIDKVRNNPYQADPQTVAEQGYDPKSIAAAFVLLHNQSHPARENLLISDTDRLVDIFQKRHKMQRAWERKQKKTPASPPAPPVPTNDYDRQMADRMTRQFLEEWGDSLNDKGKAELERLRAQPVTARLARAYHHVRVAYQQSVSPSQLTDDTLYGLSWEFTDWVKKNNKTNPYDDQYKNMPIEDFVKKAPKGWKPRGPLGHWPNIEDFLKERYPAAYRGLEFGFEDAEPLLDRDDTDPEWVEAHPWVKDKDPYETGPEAYAKYGYDPKEVAAAFLILHNSTHQGRDNWLQTDQQRLIDIMQKRMQMQRDYEQRQLQTAHQMVAQAQLEQRIAAIADDTINRLRDEFRLWHETKYPAYTYTHKLLHSWPNIEYFLKDNYPAASRDELYMGMEHVRPLLRQRNDQWGDVPQNSAPYETGREAVENYGYDPAEVIAGMLYLHNDRPGRQDLLNANRNLILKIIRNRRKMQREYDSQPRQLELPFPELGDAQKTLVAAYGLLGQAHRTAMPAPTPDGLRFEHDPGDDWSRPPTARAYLHGQPVAQLSWYPDNTDHPVYRGLSADPGAAPGKVHYISVDQSFRRQGIATALYDWAKANVAPQLQHSDNLTGPGAAWAQHEVSR